MASNTFSLTPETTHPPTHKTILITGAASGIGLATALFLHTPGLNNNVAVLDRAPSPPQLPDLTASPRFLYAQCDVTKWDSQRAAFARAASHFGGLDAVFINAGIAEHGEQIFTDGRDADGRLSEPDRRTVEVDLVSVGDSLKLAVHHLRDDGDARTGRRKGSGRGRGGSVVMTASLAGYLGSAGAPLYSAAKHGVVGYLRALKADCAKVGVAISVIAPGITLTPIVSGRRQGQSIEDWGREMQQRGVAINDAETVALVVAHVMGLGQKANGSGYLVQANRIQEVEGGYAKTRQQWMGKEMVELFRSGRNAPLFPNKL